MEVANDTTNGDDKSKSSAIQMESSLVTLSSESLSDASCLSVYLTRRCLFVVQPGQRYQQQATTTVSGINGYILRAFRLVKSKLTTLLSN